MILGGSSHRRFVLFRSYCQKKSDVEWILQKSKPSTLKCSVKGEHITDIYITETDTTELENLSHNIIDIFIIET